MDIIYANENMEDVGILLDYSLDVAIGEENSIEVTLDRTLHCCDVGYFIYAEGTEYGGIVDEIETDVDSNEVKYRGRTWRGMLEKKILEPNTGESYLIVSGEANTVLSELMSRIGLGDLFTVSTEDSGFTINSFQFNRYTDALAGINKMLKSVGARLEITYALKVLTIKAVALVDYSENEQLSNDIVSTDITKTYRTVNHLICLGQGELSERTVIHLYADADGNISQTQTFTGADEIAEVYDYSSVESEEELLNSGIEKLEEYQGQITTNLDVEETMDIYSVGDILGVKDELVGVSITGEITKKIVTINNGIISTEYKIGD